MTEDGLPVLMMDFFFLEDVQHLEKAVGLVLCDRTSGAAAVTGLPSKEKTLYTIALL